MHPEDVEELVFLLAEARRIIPEGPATVTIEELREGLGVAEAAVCRLAAEQLGAQGSR